MKQQTQVLSLKKNKGQPFYNRAGQLRDPVSMLREIMNITGGYELISGSFLGVMAYRISHWIVSRRKVKSQRLKKNKSDISLSVL